MPISSQAGNMDVRDSRPRRARSTSAPSSVRKLAPAWLVLALAIAGAARAQETVTEAEEAVRRATTPSERAAAHVALGRAYFSKREEDKAIAEFRTALTVDPHSGEAYLALGQVRFFQGNLPAAHEELRRAIEVAPDFAPAYAALGEVLAEQGRHAEARSALEKAVILDSGDWESQYRLAALLIDAGEAARARSEERRVGKESRSRGAR